MSESHGALLDDAVSIDPAEDAATASEADPHAEAVAGNGEVATGHDDDDDDDDDERDWKRKRRSDDGGDDDAGRDQPYRGAGPDKRQRTRYTAGAESGATESAPPSAGAGAGAGAGGDLGAQDEDTSSNAPDMPPPGTCVKLRGLPYTATADDVRSFLKGCDVKTVVLCHNSTGDAFVVLASMDEVERAAKYHRQNMGRRYVEVYNCGSDEVVAAQHGRQQDADFKGVVKMRGLPYDVTEDQIRAFFEGYPLAKERAVTICMRKDGNRGTGDAYVVFQSVDICYAAIKALNKKEVGSRWIDLIPASKGELYSYRQRQAPQGVNADFDFSGVVHVKGIPYSTSEVELEGFFRECRVSKVIIMRRPDGRSLGSAYVLLKDAKDIAVAVAKDRQELGGRWLEIYKADRAELFRATGSFAALRGDASYGGVVLLSGLPFRIGPKDIMKFCAGYEIQRNGVFIINDRSGRPSGQAFVVFHGEDIAAAARDALDEQKFGDRTVRAKLTNKGELYRATSRPPQQSGRGPPLLDLAVHVKGLPFVVDDEELRALFRGLPVRRIINPVDERGRGSGDAFVEFDTPEAAQEAMSKNREHVGPRYVELFLANKDDIYRFMARHAERMAPSRDRYMSHGRYAHPPPPMADNGYHRGYAPRRHDDDRRGGFAMDRRPAERYDRRDGRHSGYDRGGRHPGREPRDRYDHGRRW